MPTTTIPNSTETTVAWHRTGITGTIGVRVVDNAANTTAYGRNTGIVSEYPAGSGVYQATIPAFANPGAYTIVWDDTVRWDAIPLTMLVGVAPPVDPTATFAAPFDVSVPVLVGAFDDPYA